MPCKSRAEGQFGDPVQAYICGIAPGVLPPIFASLVTIDNNAVLPDLLRFASVGLGYGYDGTRWRRSRVSRADQASDERLMAILSRAAAAGLDQSRPVGQRLRPVEARAALAAQAPGLVRLLVDSGLRVSDGANWRALMGGQDNAAAPASPVGAFIAGVARAALPAYADGDVVIPNFDLQGRLLVNAEGLVDTDDNAIAQGQETGLSIVENYIHNGAGWIRAQGGVDNVAAGGANQGAFVAGIARTALPVYADGDVALPTFDLTGRLQVNAEGILDTDDDSIAAAQETSLVIPLNYAFTGAAWQRIQARGAVADQAYTINRLLTDSVVRGDDATDYPVIAARAAVADQAYTLVRLLTDSVVRGDDGTDYPAIAARASGAAHSEALIHLLSSSCVYGYDATLGVGARDVPIGTDLASAISGRLATAFRGLNTDSLMCGIDNTVAAPNNVLRPVEARALSGYEGAASTLLGLLTMSQMAALDGSNGFVYRILSQTGNSPSAGVNENSRGLFVLQARESGFAAARRGRRFYATHQTPGTLVTGQTAFVTTTPTYMYRINVATIRAIIRSIHLSLANTPGGLVYVTLAIDTADRWSAGGSLETLQNTNEESATAAAGLFYENPTATAAGGGTRYLGTWIMPATPGASLDLDLQDGVLLGITASTLLIYVYAATTAPQIAHVIDLEEVS